MQTGFLRRLAKKMQFRQLYDRAGTLLSPFHGVYETWEQAEHAIPRGRQIGYDHADAANMYVPEIEKIRLSDYAALFWLRPALLESSVLFDLGGNIGISYYAFRKFIKYPDEFRWVVCDVAAVTRIGRELARERKEARLSFTEDFQQADGADILHTAGTLQCMNASLSVQLSRLKRKPRHLLINRTPLYSGSTFFTVRDRAPLTLVYQVFNRDEFIQSFQNLGYQLVDSWSITEKACGTCVIPFHPEKSIRAYSGLYFRRNEP